MDEPVRWVTKAEAAEELEVSLSTLDRKIRNGEVEVRREGRRVFVRDGGGSTSPTRNCCAGPSTGSGSLNRPCGSWSREYPS